MTCEMCSVCVMWTVGHIKHLVKTKRPCCLKTTNSGLRSIEMVFCFLVTFTDFWRGTKIVLLLEQTTLIEVGKPLIGSIYLTEVLQIVVYVHTSLKVLFLIAITTSMPVVIRDFSSGETVMQSSTKHAFSPSCVAHHVKIRILNSFFPWWGGTAPRYPSGICVINDHV